MAAGPSDFAKYSNVCIAQLSINTTRRICIYNWGWDLLVNNTRVSKVIMSILQYHKVNTKTCLYKAVLGQSQNWQIIRLPLRFFIEHESPSDSVESLGLKDKFSQKPRYGYIYIHQKGAMQIILHRWITNQEINKSHFPDSKTTFLSRFWGYRIMQMSLLPLSDARGTHKIRTCDVTSPITQPRE